MTNRGEKILGFFFIFRYLFYCAVAWEYELYCIGGSRGTAAQGTVTRRLWVLRGMYYCL